MKAAVVKRYGSPQVAEVERIPRPVPDPDDVALCFGGTTALDFFRRVARQPGERVLINGASGTVGSAMVQIAVAAGAQVTAVCSGANVELVGQLGAERVVDYPRTDFASEGVQYDLIADPAGNAPYSRARAALARFGRLLLVVPTLPELFRVPWVNRTTQHRIVAGPAAERVEDVRALVAMATEGRFVPVIDSCYSLDQIAAAHARVESGRKRGSVVVR